MNIWQSKKNCSLQKHILESAFREREALFFWGKAAPSMEGLPQARRSGTKWSGDQALAGPGTRLAKQFAPKRIIKKNQKKADKIVCQKKKIIKK